MTKLTYIVLGTEYTSYTKAKEAADEYKVPLTRRYSPFEGSLDEAYPQYREEKENV